MIDSREKGKPLKFGPKAESHLSGFRITLTESLEEVVKVRFEVERYDLWRWMQDDYYRIVCPRCGDEQVDEEHHVVMWYEEHLVRRHGPEFPEDHPFYREPHFHSDE